MITRSRYVRYSYTVNQNQVKGLTFTCRSRRQHLSLLVLLPFLLLLLLFPSAGVRGVRHLGYLVLRRVESGMYIDEGVYLTR